MRWRELPVVLPLLVVAVAVALRWHGPASTFIDRFSAMGWDAYQRATPRPYVPAPVRVVAIDDASLTEHGQWPWPRTILARLTERLATAGAASIGFDMVFAEPDRTSPRLLFPVMRESIEEAGISEAQFARLPDHDA